MTIANERDRGFTIRTMTTTLTTENPPEDILNNSDERRMDADHTFSGAQKQYKSIIGTYGAELKWVNIVSIVSIHLALLWGLLTFPVMSHLRLLFYACFIGTLCGLGVTAGAHRLWCHRSYKATLPLRTFLMLCFSMAAQNSLFDWVRDHRVHHRYTETDADPHNSNRGFFFAHVGWLMMKKHPEVVRRGREVDLSDLLADPVVQFHQKYFLLLKIMVAFVIPSIIPILCWDEDLYWSVIVICVGRYVLSLNFTWLVNSAAHMWGNKPYDNKISPAENVTVAVLALGEGWHNYHHTFPWDYKTAELGNYSVNITTLFLDLFAKAGLAYDLKTPSEDLIRKVVLKNGDGSHREIPESAELDLLISPFDNNNNRTKDR